MQCRVNIAITLFVFLKYQSHLKVSLVRHTPLIHACPHEKSVLFAFLVLKVFEILIFSSPKVVVSKIVHSSSEFSLCPLQVNILKQFSEQLVKLLCTFCCERSLKRLCGVVSCAARG